MMAVENAVILCHLIWLITALAHFDIFPIEQYISVCDYHLAG